MWGNRAKWVWTRTHNIFRFLLHIMLHSKSYILQKTPSKLHKSLQSYGLLNGCENNKKQRDLFPLFSSISKSIFANSDSFCLITPHMVLNFKCGWMTSSLNHEELTMSCLQSLFMCVMLDCSLVIASRSLFIYGHGNELRQPWVSRWIN